MTESEMRQHLIALTNETSVAVGRLQFRLEELVLIQRRQMEVFEKIAKRLKKGKK